MRLQFNMENPIKNMSITHNRYVEIAFDSVNLHRQCSYCILVNAEIKRSLGIEQSNVAAEGGEIFIICHDVQTPVVVLNTCRHYDLDHTLVSDCCLMNFDVQISFLLHILLWSQLVFLDIPANASQLVEDGYFLSLLHRD